MRILVACEESQAVTIEMRKLGHEAYSCDIEPCSGGHPEWHLQQDVVPLLSEKWDMIIAFPPCTHLAVSGARNFEAKNLEQRPHRFDRLRERNPKEWEFYMYRCCTDPETGKRYGWGRVLDCIRVGWEDVPAVQISMFDFMS